MVGVTSLGIPRLTGRRRIAHDRAVQDTSTLGEEFAHALAQKDADRMRELLHPDIDFRGLTPSRNWDASDRDAVTRAVSRELVRGVQPDRGDGASRERQRRRPTARGVPVPRHLSRRSVHRRAAGVPGRARRTNRMDARRLLRIPTIGAPRITSCVGWHRSLHVRGDVGRSNSSSRSTAAVTLVRYRFIAACTDGSAA